MTTQLTIRQKVEEMPGESGSRTASLRRPLAGIQKGASRERIDSTPD